MFQTALGWDMAAEEKVPSRRQRAQAKPRKATQTRESAVEERAVRTRRGKSEDAPWTARHELLVASALVGWARRGLEGAGVLAARVVQGAEDEEGRGDVVHVVGRVAVLVESGRVFVACKGYRSFEEPLEGGRSE